MRLAFFRYFTAFIFKAKNRQKLLILAISGLILSSFSLIVLQSTMGGLQKKLMERSISVLGYGSIYFSPKNQDQIEKVKSFLKTHQFPFTEEYEAELILKHKTYLTPVIVHGINELTFIPDFLKSEGFKQAVVPLDIAYKLELLPPVNLKLISPIHVDSFFEDIPRSQTVTIDRTFYSSVPEIDQYHMWVKLSTVQNLVQSHSINKIRIYHENVLKALQKEFKNEIQLKTWHEENATLVWALKLESFIMVFLFGAMSLLISLTVVSGLLIFYSKIKNDLSSFWILGCSLSRIEKTHSLFLYSISFFSVTVGLILGVLFLYLFDHFAPEIMPEVFVDRKIPIAITFKGISLSFLIPFLISSIFVRFSILQFKKDYNLLDHVRSIS